MPHSALYYKSAGSSLLRRCLPHRSCFAAGSAPGILTFDICLLHFDLRVLRALCSSCLCGEFLSRFQGLRPVLDSACVPV